MSLALRRSKKHWLPRGHLQDKVFKETDRMGFCFSAVAALTAFADDKSVKAMLRQGFNRKDRAAIEDKGWLEH